MKPHPRHCLLRILLPALFLLLPALPIPSLLAQSGMVGDAKPADAPLEYKMIAGFKDPFNETLQSHLSDGWKPVGGVSVTVWNDALYFAQLLCRKVGKP